MKASPSTPRTSLSSWEVSRLRQTTTTTLMSSFEYQPVASRIVALWRVVAMIWSAIAS